MLPKLLCEELCSLNPMTDRLTFSVIWKLTPEGKVNVGIFAGLVHPRTIWGKLPTSGGGA